MIAGVDWNCVKVYRIIPGEEKRRGVVDYVVEGSYCLSLLTSQEYWNGDEESAHSTGSTHTGLLEIFVGPGGEEGVIILLWD